MINCTAAVLEDPVVEDPGMKTPPPTLALSLARDDDAVAAPTTAVRTSSVEIAADETTDDGTRIRDDVFWLGEDDALRAMTAEAVLQQLEDGRISADALLRIEPSAKPKRLGRYVRELVWLSHKRHVSDSDADPDSTQLRAAFDGAPVGMVLSDLAGRILRANDAFCTMLGYGRNELTGMRVGKLSSVRREREIELGNELLAGARNSFQIEKQFQARNGRMVDTLTAIAAVRDVHGAPIQVIAQVVDLTEMKQLERLNRSIRRDRAALDELNTELERRVKERTLELRASEARFLKLFQQAPQAMVMVDEAQRVSQANSRAQALFGYDNRELLGLPAADLMPTEFADDRPQDVAELEDGAATEGRVVDGVRSTGERFSAEVNLVPIPEQGERHILAGIKDVSEQLAAQDALTASLDEKETLLREIHHRVKNNLQVISSLLMLQGDKLVSAEARAVFENSVHRVRSMSLIHEQLHSGESIKRIDFGDYARRLLRSLRAAYAPTAQIDVRAATLDVTVDVAVPLGLILNELLTNALKYGVRERAADNTDPDVCVTITAVDEELHLEVRDWGGGLAADFDVETSPTLGLQIVRSLCQQLRGKLTVSNDGGARFVIVCPLPARD